MYMHDPFIRLGYVRRARRFRWPWGRQRSWPGARVHRPYRRRLAAIERALITDAPALSLKFAVFNELTDGERPLGTEQVPGLAPPGPLRAHLALFVALAVFTALCVTLTLQGRRVLPQCSFAAAAAARASAHAPVRGLPCRAYPAAK